MDKLVKQKLEEFKKVYKEWAITTKQDLIINTEKISNESLLTYALDEAIRSYKAEIKEDNLPF